MSAFNFELLEREGIPTHYKGVLNSSGEIVQTSDLTEPSNQMAIKLARVIEPTFSEGKYNYEFFTENRGEINNFVIPLEVIYRKGAPLGSSLFKKIKQLEDEGKTDELKNFLAPYGLTQKPNPGDMFPRTGYDFTTKFESIDKRLEDSEAFKISGLSSIQFMEMEDIRDNAVSIVSRRFNEVGLKDYDGKLEFVYLNGILVGDVIGTPDENRIFLKDEQVSKELPRQWYKKFQPEWYTDCERAKSEAISNGIKDWTSLLKIQPNHLPEELVELVGEMYMACSDRYTGLNLFNIRPLEQVMEDIRPYRN